MGLEGPAEGSWCCYTHGCFHFTSVGSRDKRSAVPVSDKPAHLLVTKGQQERPAWDPTQGRAAHRPAGQLGGGT